MKKLSLLIPLLLGATVATTSAEAASISELHAYEQKVTMTVNTKIYKDSKLQSSTNTKQGTVYQANGYRMINGQKYYRVYQSKYKGYVKASQTQTLVAKKINARYYVNTNNQYNMWGNLYFDKVKGQLQHYALDCVHYVKYRYDLPNGRSYLSIYDDQHRDQWLGYVNDDAYRVLKQEKYTKHVALNVKHTVTPYKDFNGTDVKPTLTANTMDYVYPKYQYRMNQLTIISIYGYDSKQGKEKWLGYVNENDLTPYVNRRQLDYQEQLLHAGKECVNQATDKEKQSNTYRDLVNIVKETEMIMNSKETVEMWIKKHMSLSGYIENFVNTFR